MNEFDITKDGQTNILIVDDEKDMLDACSMALIKSGYTVDAVDNSKDALKRIKDKIFSLVITDLRMEDMNGIELLKAAKKVKPSLLFIIITAYATIETAIEATKEGASDYLTKPFVPNQLRMVVKRVLEEKKLKDEMNILKENLQSQFKNMEILGNSPSMKKINTLINKVAKTDSTVLIQGESGTGKELIAHEIHKRSDRSKEPFVIINCSATPENLMESEFFGHEKGSFTSADRLKRGSFEIAHKGTIFLDEIGDIRTDLQVKFLRVLQEKKIKRIGGNFFIDVDVRIIAATNRNLKKALKDGNFREDLYYRLNIFPISVPPLRERKDDIPILVHYFLNIYAKKMNKEIHSISKEAMEAMMDYNWPGNIRELENSIERAAILENSEELSLENFAFLIPTPESSERMGIQSDLPSLEEMERDYIKKVLEFTKWNKSKASQILGISPVTIWRKIDQQDK